METRIWALPGFLGCPSDWDKVRLENISGINLFDYSLEGFDQWVSEFNRSIEQRGFERNILMGYSLGGRLALHALLENPATSPWHAAIIVSAHPGYQLIEERQERLARSRYWAQRFKHDSWDDVMKEWNDQNLFRDDPCPFIRRESDYSLDILIKQLLNFSVGIQYPLQDRIGDLKIPILWIAGEKDSVYASVARTMKFHHPASKVVIVPGVGHRIPWCCPDLFCSLVRSFILNIAQSENLGNAKAPAVRRS